LGLFKETKEEPAAALSGTKAGEMMRIDLTVDQTVAKSLKCRDRCRKDHLRGSLNQGEHRLSREGATQGDTIKATDEATIQPS